MCLRTISRTTASRPTVVTLRTRARRLREFSEAGMTTAEYAVGTLAACTFAAVLIAVVKSGSISAALTTLITNALGVGG